MGLKFVQRDAQAKLQVDGYVVGIDVGWSASKATSSVCILKWSASRIEIEFPKSPNGTINFCFRLDSRQDADVIAAAAKPSELDSAPLTVAIDGPLGTRIDSPPTVYRHAEKTLSRGEFRHFGRPGSAAAPVGVKLGRQTSLVASAVWKRNRFDEVRGNDLLRGPIVEAFPNAFLASLLPDETRELVRPQLQGNRLKSDLYYTHLHDVLLRLLGRLLPGRKVDKDLRKIEDHDQRASFVCALAALCVAVGEFAHVGKMEEGVIVLPPPATADAVGMTAWAQDCLGRKDIAQTGRPSATPPARLQSSNPGWNDLATAYLRVVRIVQAGKTPSTEDADRLRSALNDVNLTAMSAYRIAAASQLGPVERLKPLLGLPPDLRVEPFTDAWFLGLAHDLALKEHPILGDFWGGGTPRDPKVAAAFLPLFDVIRSLDRVAETTATKMFALLLECLVDKLR